MKIPEYYTLGLILALGYPSESPLHYDIGKDESIKYFKDSSSTLHVPKRRLDDIIHINSFQNHFRIFIRVRYGLLLVSFPPLFGPVFKLVFSHF